MSAGILEVDGLKGSTALTHHTHMTVVLQLLTLLTLILLQSTQLHYNRNLALAGDT